MELRRGNRSLHATFRSGGSAALSVTEMPKWGGDGTNMRPKVRGEAINIAHSPKYNKSGGGKPHATRHRCIVIAVAERGAKVYKANVKVGADISELNLVLVHRQTCLCTYRRREAFSARTEP